MTTTNNEIHGIKPEYMDKSAKPGVDFNRYANGKWIDNTQIPPGETRWGSFNILHNQNIERLHTLMQQLAAKTDAAPGSNEKKIGDFFTAGMDEAKIEAAGLAPLADAFARIARIRSASGLAATLAHLHANGINVFFGFGSQTDFADSSREIAAMVQGGLGLPNRDYYLGRDKVSRNRRYQYTLHMRRMFDLLGEKPLVARRHADAVMEIETALARASMADEDIRDPHNITHPMTVDKLCELISAIPMRRYFQAVGAPCFETLNVFQPKFIKALNQVLSKKKLADIKAYLRWHLISAAAPYLSSAFFNENFDFYGKTLSGLKEPKPRWKRVVETVDSALGEAIGELYVAKYFPPTAKARIEELVGTLKEVLKESIDKLDWMSPETRARAQAKLAKTVLKLGYPDKWEDYSALSISRDSYVANVFATDHFAHQQDMDKIGKPVDRSIWGMTPQTVNAYANDQLNEIVFPAAILQPPFYDPLADTASNLGGIMVVIGHELTHLFDDSGAKYDEIGNVKSWWKKRDFNEFMRRIALIRKQFDKFTVGPNNVHLKGNLVSGEAAADLGGVRLSFKALQKYIAKNGRQTDSNGFTDEQRFFIAFAQIWASKSTPESDERQAKENEHPVAQYRVNGTLAHVQEFADAFNLPANSPIMLPESKRCHMW